MARSLIACLVIALAAVAGCLQAPESPSDDNTPSPTPASPESSGDMCVSPDLAPQAGAGGQSSVANYPGSFSYSGQTTLQSGREVYIWQNPSSGAMVSWSGQAATGDLSVSIQDVCGKEVYSAKVGMMDQGGASASTESGEPGDWFIVLDFTAFTGQMGLSISSA